jgi:dihydroanticapsin dehydrogenase
MSKVFVITGGTSGVGKELSKRFGRKNTIYVLARNIDKINLVQKELNNKNIVFIKCDLMVENDIKNAFSIISSKEKCVDVLINNAAYDKMSCIEFYNYEVFSQIINTNLSGKMLCIKYCIPLLKKSKYPTIINISSRLATKPMLNSSAYCCAAAGIVMLTKCAALELEKYSIRVNCISPSMIETPLSLKSYSKEEIMKTENLSTRKRLCKINDVYNLVCFLISSHSDYINGENINVNSGILLK